MLPLASAYLLVHGSFSSALGVVLLLPLAVWFFSRPALRDRPSAAGYGLSLGLVLTLVVPNWWWIAGRHAYQVAAIAAALGALSARRVRFTPTDYAVIAYMALQVFGWVLQYDQPTTGQFVLDQLIPLGFYVGARAAPQARLTHFMTLALFAGTLGALTVIFEFMRGAAYFVDPTQYSWQSVNGGLFRPGGIFGDPPGAATALTYVLFFGMAALTALRGRMKTLGLVCMLICTVALILTFTRAPLIGAGVGLIVYLWLLRSPQLRPGRLAIVGVTLVTVLLVTLPSLGTNTTFKEGILRGGTFAARENYWADALPIAFANPHNFILGLGTGVLETPAVNYNPLAPLPLSVATYPQSFELSSAGAIGFHNQYLEALVEQGIIGVTALVVLLLAGFVPAARRARATGDARYAALAAAILATAIGFTAGTNLTTETPTRIMLLAAIGLAANARGNRDARRAAPGTPFGALANHHGPSA